MFTFKLLIALTLVSAVAVLSGCVTSGTVCNPAGTPKVAQAPQERVVTKEVLGPERIVYIDRDVIKEVPGPERVIIKEIEVPVVPPKAVAILPLVVIPGALFDFDKSTLKPHGIVEMHNAVAILKNRHYPIIVINGHTDPVGKKDYNQKLSERRAETVRVFLAKYGVPAYTLTTHGYGERMPIASNLTEEGKALNRRVEIYQVNP